MSDLAIRLLVGLNVDSLVFELERTNADISRLNEANKAKFTQVFSKAQQKSIQKESYQSTSRKITPSPATRPRIQSAPNPYRAGEKRPR